MSLSSVESFNVPLFIIVNPVLLSLILIQFDHSLSSVSEQFMEPVDVIVKSSVMVFEDVWVVAVEIVSACN